MANLGYVNTEWVKTVTKEIDQIPDCDALAELIKAVEKMIKEQLEALLEEMAKLLELALPPTNLKKLIAWAKKHCGKYYEMYLKVVATYAELAKAYSDLLTAIQNKLNKLQCNIKMPSVNDIIPSIPDSGLFKTVNDAYKDIAALKQNYADKDVAAGLLNVSNMADRVSTDPEKSSIANAGGQADGYIASKPPLDRPTG
jgi:hypothetical protein